MGIVTHKPCRKSVQNAICEAEKVVVPEIVDQGHQYAVAIAHVCPQPQVTSIQAQKTMGENNDPDGLPSW